MLLCWYSFSSLVIICRGGSTEAVSNAFQIRGAYIVKWVMTKVTKMLPWPNTQFNLVSVGKQIPVARVLCMSSCVPFVNLQPFTHIAGGRRLWLGESSVLLQRVSSLPKFLHFRHFSGLVAILVVNK